MSPKIVAALCLSAALVSVASSARAQEPAPVKPTVVAEERPQEFPTPDVRWKLLLTGAGVTAGFYGAAAGMSYLFPDAPGANDLRMPVIGPWQAIYHNGCAVDEPDCSQVMVVIRTILTAIDGAGQVGGLGVMLESAFVPTQERAPARPGPVAPPKPTPGTEKNLFYLPMPTTVGSTGIGVTWGGAF